MRLVGFFIGVLCGVFQLAGWYAVAPEFIGFNLPIMPGVVMLIVSAVIVTIVCCYTSWREQ